ncbi:hypothetical protein V495_01303 [Pseudogymnoascus sp. VKM F-4514 (FW-929)]|nr:hypothetical protein V495_01303 [Pseudogymnoascus sp. VKM F-4514 (FW-929)]KFY59229.1 hypothetical protein V497_04453 [Pseudogymnoascus sp. VKM F-4516 (FW-969)]
MASSDSNSSFTIEYDVPPWHPLYFVQSEVKRLLGPVNDESFLLEDDNLHDDQSPSEVKDDNYYSLQGSPETCESNDSRPLALVPTAQQQLSSNPDTNSFYEIDLTAYPLHTAYLQQGNSIPCDKIENAILGDQNIFCLDFPG